MCGELQPINCSPQIRYRFLPLFSIRIVPTEQMSKTRSKGVVVSLKANILSIVKVDFYLGKDTSIVGVRTLCKGLQDKYFRFYRSHRPLPQLLNISTTTACSVE